MKSGSITHLHTTTRHPKFIKHIISTFRKTGTKQESCFNLTYRNKFKSNNFFTDLLAKIAMNHVALVIFVCMGCALRIASWLFHQFFRLSDV